MKDYIAQNKTAWEYDAYGFWLKQMGTPQDYARKLVADPISSLRRFGAYFDSFAHIRVANICGSCGKKAVPLALLGAQVTLFDISSQNHRYASELAAAAGVELDHQICDILQSDMSRYGNAFDIVFWRGVSCIISTISMPLWG